MITEVIIQRLDELIGDYNTPFFNYLLYSYDLSLDECEFIIEELKSDINAGNVVPDNIAKTLEDCFRSRVTSLEKQEKIEYLSSLIGEDNDFYIKYLKKYNLDSKDMDMIYNRIESRIYNENISDFEIKRYLEYYFANAVRQTSYINELNNIVGNDYDTLIIQAMKRKYPILNDRDIIQIVFNIHGQIIEATDFKKGIKDEFQKQCMRKSEDKKAQCRRKLNGFVEGSGDSFSQLVEFKNLTKSDGEKIVRQIEDDIMKGLIQPERIDSVFITKRFNDYNERQ
ncbi:MAG: hypothetical protein Q4Q18_00245 [Methanobrevibacter sp.]|nr:hypothetical protein [Methanobrevibacter sp.]